MNLPGSLIELESDLRRQISDTVSRGRVNCRVNLTHVETGDNHLFFDDALARQYVESARKLSESVGIENRFTAADLFRAPGVFRIEEAGLCPEKLGPPLQEALSVGLKELVKMQKEEGEHLREDLIHRLSLIADEVEEVKNLAPLVKENFRKNLFARLEDSGLEIDLDDDRVLREIGVFAERSDISEELTRIDHHIVQFRKYFAGDEPTGRSLDFLCQELNRELNTIGSKANDAGIAQRIVNSKTELEKIREQVQNVQ